jgi:hypothetical protein
MPRLIIVMLLLVGARPVFADQPVVTEANLAFHSAFWVNLHHTLFGAAWDRRPQTSGRRLIPALPQPLSAPLSDDERKTWDAAIGYYEGALASEDLRTGRGMTAIKRALADERLDAPAIAPELRAVLESAAPIYRRYYWAAHDRSNRAWIDDIVGRLRSVERELVPALERAYARPWFSAPVRVDVTWVGRAYTTLQPTHTVMSPAEPNMTGWLGLEIVLHEAAHELIQPTDEALASALGDRRRAHGDLWHAVQFYLSGTVLQQILRQRSIDYSPYLYATGLFDRAWKEYRPLIEQVWSAYLRGDITRDVAIERTVAGLPSR